MRRFGLLLALSVLMSACGQAAQLSASPSQPGLNPAASHATQSTNASPPASASLASPSGAADISASPSAAGALAVPSPGADVASPSARSVAIAAKLSSPGSSAVSAAASGTATQLAAIPPAKRIGPLTFISQTLNNCGPASVAEVLAYFGVQRSQAQVAQVLRPDLPAYGMSLYGVPYYAESVGLRASGGVNGNDTLIKDFIANGIPVIVSDLVSPNDRTRHFRPIDGYDDANGYFIGSDPYLGANHEISYADFDEIWKISNSRWVVLYPPAKQNLIDAVLERSWNRAQAVQQGMQRALQRSLQQPNLPWSWLELADMQIDAGNVKDAGPNIQKGMQLGLPFEAHWLQMKLQRAGGTAA